MVACSFPSKTLCCQFREASDIEKLSQPRERSGQWSTGRVRSMKVIKSGSNISKFQINVRIREEQTNAIDVMASQKADETRQKRTKVNYMEIDYAV